MDVKGDRAAFPVILPELCCFRATRKTFGGELNSSVVKRLGKGSTVDVKGSTVDVKGSTVDVKGSTVDVKGSIVDVKGSTVDVKGSTVDVKGST
eukprot:3660122-Pyramimonas_sp.AAC.1